MKLENKLINSIIEFNLQNNIYNGEFSNVYNAFDNIDRNLVIKRLSKEKLKKDLTKFYDEAKIINKLKHPNIVEIIFASEDDNYIYIALPLYINGSVDKYRYKNDGLSLTQIIKYILHVIIGLNQIHRNGLYHFDLKLENILISDNDIALITDFGLAKYYNEFGLANPSGKTLHFVPYEYFDYKDFNISYDMYQLGFVILRFFYSDEDLKKIFKDNDMNIKSNFKSMLKKGKYPEYELLLPHIPLKLITIIKRLLHYNPDKRYLSCIDVINEISKLEISINWKYKLNENIEEWISESKSVISDYNGLEYDVKYDGFGKKNFITKFENKQERNKYFITNEIFK